MCDTTRRCDKPSCPCNEPDTELKDALTRMQERFPNPWRCSVGLSASGSGWLALAELGRSDVQVAMYGRTPHAAVDAAINAWDSAVKADALFKVLKAECEAARKCDAAYRYCEHGIGEAHTDEEWADATDALTSARAETDKAGALR